MYQQVKNILDEVAPSQVVKRLADNAFIPFDRDNRDYVEYLEWLEAGNTPLPADEQGEQNV